MSREYSIGIDIGGTKIAAGLVNRAGKVIGLSEVPTPNENRQGIYKVLRDLVHSLTRFAARQGIAVKGIGIGTAGQIDFAGGRVLSGTTNIADWNDVPLRDEMSKYISLPVWVDNDVNAAALAEYHFGAARGHNDAVCLTLGTGVGGGVITGGTLLRGAWGGAAELGHMTIDLNGPACNCGFRGCLETYASGTGIARSMREKLASFDTNDGPAYALFKKDPSLITSRLVFEWKKNGDPLAVEAMNEMTTALSFGIVNLIHVFNPTMVVLGGGIMKDGEWIRDAVRQKAGTLGLRSLVDPVTIEIAELGAAAGLIGAAYQCWLYG
ncbi:ROK family protein [Paenibacillus tarimensis]